MNNARRRQDVTYQEYLRDQKAEQEAEQTRLDAERDADPTLMAQKAMDASALATRETLLNGVAGEDLLPNVERRNGKIIGDMDAARRNFQFFKRCSTFKPWMEKQLLTYATQHDIAPVAPAFLALHNLLLEYGCYEEPVAAPVAVERVEPAVFTDHRGYQWTQSEIDELPPDQRASLNHQIYTDQIIGHDESGKPWTEQMLDNLVIEVPDGRGGIRRESGAKEALRLRRLFTKGHRGNQDADNRYASQERQKAYETSLAVQGFDAELADMGFGTPVRDREFDQQQIEKDFEKFSQSGLWKKSDRGARLLISTLQSADLLPWIENLKIVAAYLKATGKL
jgi:hypothetical protein